MLKFTNTTKTAAAFNGAFFSLEAPEDWASIGDGPTRQAVLAWLAEGNTPESADAVLPPSKPEQIDALLAAKGVTRLLVQLTIEVSEDKARALAPSYGMTAEQGIAYAYSKNKSYRECKDLETAIRVIETTP